MGLSIKPCPRRFTGPQYALRFFTSSFTSPRRDLYAGLCGERTWCPIPHTLKEVTMKKRKINLSFWTADNAAVRAACSALPTLNKIDMLTKNGPLDQALNFLRVDAVDAVQRHMTAFRLGCGECVKVSKCEVGQIVITTPDLERLDILLNHRHRKDGWQVNLRDCESNDLILKVLTAIEGKGVTDVFFGIESPPRSISISEARKLLA